MLLDSLPLKPVFAMKTIMVKLGMVTALVVILKCHCARLIHPLQFLYLVISMIAALMYSSDALRLKHALVDLWNISAVWATTMNSVGNVCRTSIGEI